MSDYQLASDFRDRMTKKCYALLTGKKNHKKVAKQYDMKKVLRTNVVGDLSTFTITFVSIFIRLFNKKKSLR